MCIFFLHFAEQLYDELIDCTTKDKAYYSAYFVSLQVEFVSGQPSLVKDLIRLVKYWRKTCIEDKSIGKKTRLPSSYPLELITIGCRESAGSEEKFDIRAGFKAVLEKLVHYCNIHVIWYKYYDEALAKRGIKGTIKRFVLFLYRENRKQDPGGGGECPYNNFGGYRSTF